LESYKRLLVSGLCGGNMDGIFPISKNCAEVGQQRGELGRSRTDGNVYGCLVRQANGKTWAFKGKTILGVVVFGSQRTSKSNSKRIKEWLHESLGTCLETSNSAVPHLELWRGGGSRRWKSAMVKLGREDKRAGASQKATVGSLGRYRTWGIGEGFWAESKKKMGRGGGWWLGQNKAS